MRNLIHKYLLCFAFIFQISIINCLAQVNESKANVSSSIDISSLFDTTKPSILVEYEHESNQSKVLMVDVLVTIWDNEGLANVVIDGEEYKLESKLEFKKIIKTPNNYELLVQAFDINNNKAISSTIINVITTVIPLKKLALVIGNSDYAHSASLKNPVNDGKAMGSTLEDLGFEVISKFDVDKNEMMNALKEFSYKITEAQIAMFYYAGHGMQVDSKNYLIPTDAQFKNGKRDVEFESISVEMITKVMDNYGGSDRLNLIILDACRNNPYRSWARGGEDGLASMSAPSGTLIAYSTAPGSVALDGVGENGLYTGELIKQLRISQRIEDVFINTRNAVERLSNGQQSPWELARLKGKYYLK